MWAVIKHKYLCRFLALTFLESLYIFFPHLSMYYFLISWLAWTALEFSGLPQTQKVSSLFQSRMACPVGNILQTFSHIRHYPVFEWQAEASGPGDLQFLFFKELILFIFGCVGSSLLCAGFLQLQRAGATLLCGVRASHCGSFSCGAWALGPRASVVVACRLSSCGSWALECRLSSCGHGLSCSVACGIFLDQGLNPCPLHWQMDAQPLCHQGSPFSEHY